MAPVTRASTVTLAEDTRCRSMRIQFSMHGADKRNRNAH